MYSHTSVAWRQMYAQSGTFSYRGFTFARMQTPLLLLHGVKHPWEQVDADMLAGWLLQRFS
ncbi:MAG: hypothetical protein IPM81_17685 [Saprospirales bacterium]|nr:hypothetical protein [Saprospirales bacterium]